MKKPDETMVKAPRRWSVATLRNKAMFAWDSEDSDLLWKLADQMESRLVYSLSCVVVKKHVAEAIKRVAKNEIP